MAWFSRKRADTPTDERAQEDRREERRPATATAASTAADSQDEAVVVPRARRLPPEERERVDRALKELSDAGVDVDDLSSLAEAYDRWLADWLDTRESKRPDHQGLVEQLGIGIGEHLVRHTDLEWALVSDAFGTDLGLTAWEDDFNLVPMNLVAVRWLNRTSGWVTGVVGHLVRLRTTMR